MNNDLQKNYSAIKEYGCNTPNLDYYYPTISPYYEFPRQKEEKFLNIASSIISPKMQEQNIFNFDFPILDIKEFNDKHQKIFESIQNKIIKRKKN